MRPHRTLALAALSLAVLAAGAALAAPAAEQAARRELTALYAQFGRLLKEQHRYPLKQFFLKHTTENFVLKQDGRTFTREDAAELMEAGPMAIVRFTGHDLKIVSLTLKGNQAVVHYRDRTTGLIPDREGNTHKLVMTSTTRDTWVKTDEGWMTRLTEVLTSKTLVDGKEIKPRKARKR